MSSFSYPRTITDEPMFAEHGFDASAQEESRTRPSTVFVGIKRKGSRSILSTFTMAAPGPTLTDVALPLLRRYRNDCDKESKSIAKDQGMSDFFSTADLQSIITTFQNRLDKVATPHPDEYRVIAIDGRDISRSWQKLSKSLKEQRKWGYLLLSVQDPKRVSKTIWSSLLKKDDTTITGCRICNWKRPGPNRVEADRHLQTFGSRYWDLGTKSTKQEWPSELAAVELSKMPEHEGCAVITVSEAFLRLPIFEDLRYMENLANQTFPDDDAGDEATLIQHTGTSVLRDDWGNQGGQLDVYEQSEAPASAATLASGLPCHTPFNVLD